VRYRRPNRYSRLWDPPKQVAPVTIMDAVGKVITVRQVPQLPARLMRDAIYSPNPGMAWKLRRVQAERTTR
jgi:hypothetical protein